MFGTRTSACRKAWPIAPALIMSSSPTSTLSGNVGAADQENCALEALAKYSATAGGGSSSALSERIAVLNGSAAPSAAAANAPNGLMLVIWLPAEATGDMQPVQSLAESRHACRASPDHCVSPT